MVSGVTGECGGITVQSEKQLLPAGSVAAGLFNISHFQGSPAPTAYITQETDVSNSQSSLYHTLCLTVLEIVLPLFLHIVT